ncbi:DUF6998 domain-containing protein [Pseudomonas sp. IT-P291]|uniref:DUF6998 domain-containing protein n=1 Tax=Pseudomonas sp. IT-P291 TaxID=3026448 RepID=UPI0039E19A4E
MKEEVQVKLKAALDTLFKAVAMLRDAFPGKPFTPDGRLVGDIGEVVAQLHYQLTLNEGLTKHHDAISDDGRMVQIKTTFSKHLTFPTKHVPDYYLGIKMLADGTYEEIYNGPGRLIYQELASRNPKDNPLHGSLMPMLRRLNQTVLDVDRIPHR